MKHFALTTLLTTLAIPAHAVDFRMMVDRDPDAIELFVQIPVGLIPAHIGALPDGFIGTDNTIDISPFREGTWAQGDIVWRNVQTAVNDQAVTFEAMSMMVHPQDYPQDFNDPIDAITAISVCNVPDPFARFAVDGLTAYLGYIAFPVDGHADFQISFPYAAQVEVMNFRNGDEVDTAIYDLAAGQGMTLVDKAPDRGWFSWLSF